MEYFFVFLITIALVYLYEHSWKKSSTVALLILELTIILLPSLLGGFRNITVGTDNLNYYNFFQYTASHGLKESLGSTYFSVEVELEKGFILFMWLVSRLGDSFFYFAFTTSFVTFLLVFEAIKYFKERYSMTIMVMMYLFIYYCPLYNYVRQGIALAIIFFAYRYVENKQFFKYVLLVLVASMLHSSAIVSIFIYVIFFFKEKIRFNKYVVLVVAVVFILIVIGPNLINNLLVQLSKVGIRSETLLKYARRFSYINQYSFVPVHMLRALPQLIVSTFFLKKIIGLDEQIKGYYILCWVQFFFMILGCAFEPFSRISLYFNYSVFILLPAISKCQINKSARLFFNAGLTVYCVVYWMIFTVLNYYGFSSPVYPYITF